MPKIYEYFGLVFFFYSNDHEPIHVHVRKGGRQSIFELYIQDGNLTEIRQRNEICSESLSDKEAILAESFIHAYYKRIIEKWMKFFVLKKRIRCTSVTRKI